MRKGSTQSREKQLSSLYLLVVFFGRRLRGSWRWGSVTSRDIVVPTLNSRTWVRARERERENAKEELLVDAKALVTGPPLLRRFNILTEIPGAKGNAKLSRPRAPRELDVSLRNFPLPGKLTVHTRRIERSREESRGSCGSYLTDSTSFPPAAPAGSYSREQKRLPLHFRMELYLLVFKCGALIQYLLILCREPDTFLCLFK